MNALPKRLKLCPTPNTYPLQDADSGAVLEASSLGFDAKLSQQIAAWDLQYQNTRGQNLPFSELDAERNWLQQGQSIAATLTQQWQGELIIRLSRLETIVQRSMLQLKPEQWYSETHAAVIAQQCSVTEIARALERLDELATDKANTEEWDDDAHEDIAKAQRLLAQTLATLPVQFLVDIAQGLYSPHSATRVYVAIALAKHGEQTLPLLLAAQAQEKDPVTSQLLDLIIEPLKAAKH